jgi:hypothetical protein
MNVLAIALIAVITFPTAVAHADDIDRGVPTLATSICHGENAKKVMNFDPFKKGDEHGCDDHPGWSVFEGCSGGGTNPAASAQALCKGSLWTVTTNFPGVSGNKCGYSWFTITCWSGP